MIFSTSKTELQKALQKVSKANPTRSTLPILSCVLIEAQNERTILRTTDLEKLGSAALPIKPLQDIANELPETRITISVDRANKATIKTDLGEYDLMARPTEEFPTSPEQKKQTTVQISGKILKEIIDSTTFAVSRDELKPALTGVFFQTTEKGIVAVSTDGHRLVKHFRTDHQTNNISNGVVVPKKFLTYLSTHLKEDSVDLVLAETHLAAKMGPDVILTRIIDEKFPNYESVIPKNNDKKFVVDKESLLGAIKRVSIFSNKSTHQVALSLGPGDCKIKTEDPEKSSKAQETIKGVYEGDEITVGYNAEYLKDVVSHIVGSNVSISLSTPVGAALFDSIDKKEGVENTMLLMPIRLND